MLILSLICGLGVGSYIPVNLSVVITAGMMLSIAMPVLGPMVSMAAIGIGVAVTAKNIIETSFNNKVNECINKIKKKGYEVKDKYKDTIAKFAAEEADVNYNKFNKTAAWMALPMYLLHVIQGLGIALLPVSIFAIVVKAWNVVQNEPEKAVTYGVVGLAVLATAFFTITSGGTSGIFIYFLTLVSIPSSLKKEDSKTTNNNDTSGTTKPLEAFLYGQGGSGSIITAMVMLQTILWGSGKDAIGTIVNGAGSIAIDPARIAACVIVVIFLYLFNKYRKQAVIEDCVKNFTNKNKDKKQKLVNLALNAVSIIFSLSVANPLVVIGLTLIGLVVNAYVDTAVIRTLAVPALLIIGTFA